MPDARCDELSGVGICHDAKSRQVNDATDYSPRKLNPQCKTPDVRPVRALTGRSAAEAPTGQILAGRAAFTNLRFRHGGTLGYQ
jgi:hypothetical protein